MAAGWVMGAGNGNVGDGIEVRWLTSGEGESEGERVERTLKFAAIVRRDELFNRLAGLAEVRWESV